MFAAVVGHLIGDYLVQNDWMAQNKKKHSWPCFVHVCCYTLAVMLTSGWPLWVAPVVFIPHFLIDRTRFIQWWMKFAHQEGFKEPPLAPWSIIVVDNVWHIFCLFLTAKLIDYV